MIKLIKLHIKTKFKNIENETIDFERSNRIAVFIGNNASGKSNILEAMSNIFAGLYDNKLNPDFSYNLDYEKESNKISIKFNYENKIYTFFLNDKELFKKVKLEFDEKKDLLPKNIICLYSGEDQKLWKNYFLPFYHKFIKNRNLSQIQEMEYINKDHLYIALILLYLNKSDIINFKDINITFNFNNRVNRANVNIELMGYLDKIKQLEIIDFESLKSFLEKNTLALQDFYKFLYLAIFSTTKTKKLIKGIDIKLENGIPCNFLSEGEKKQVLIEFVIQILADENSILLLDEPDSHIHISNKSKIKDKLFQNGKPRLQTILTTHSPTLATCFNIDSIYMLNKKENNTIGIVSNNIQNIIHDLTEGKFSFQEENLLLSSNKKIILIVEGKHDKEHIINAYEKLKEDFEGLNFDIFPAGSSTMIKTTLTSLNEAHKHTKINKIYIGIFDGDAKNEYVKKDEKITHYKKFKDFKNFYLYLLHKESIENMFDYEKYMEAYQQAFEKAKSNINLKNQSINTITKKIQNDAKDILSVDSKNFTKEEFHNFKILFKNIINIQNENLKE